MADCGASSRGVALIEATVSLLGVDHQLAGITGFAGFCIDPALRAGVTAIFGAHGLELRQTPHIALAPRRYTIAKPVLLALYGATDGHLFAAGRAGERFAVRNSGAKVVIEGCGSNGCEYMTGGVAVILGDIGANFGAGMTGGMAYLYDPEGKAPAMMNMETLVTCPVTVDHWLSELEELLEMHLEETGSRRVADILQHWDSEKHHFLQVCPKEMLVHLPAPLGTEETAVPAE